MTPRRMWLLFTGLIALLAFVSLPACEQDDGDDDDGSRPADDDLGDDDTSGGAPSYRLDFVFEYRDAGRLDLWEDGERLVGALAVGKGTDMIRGGEVIRGEGRWLDFPESGYRALAMTFQGPPTFSRCGGDPVTYSLLLTFRPPNGYLTGGLTAYCGAGVVFGRPAKLMRLSGDLVRPALP